MGRKPIAIETLHNYTIEELVELKNTIDSKYSRIALTIITMRYYKYSNPEIMKAAGVSETTVTSHIKNWNRLGMKSIEDTRGGSYAKMYPEVVDELLNVVVKNLPTDFGFTSSNWSCSLLSSYIEQNHGIKVSNETIRQTLQRNNISYKRAQPKPTRASKAEQEAFKKNFRPSEYFRIFI